MSTPSALLQPTPGVHTERALSRRNPRTLVVAHRGVWKQAPENSLAAIEDAIAIGADIVEIDVQATVDGALVVLHDDALDRTTEATGLLASSSFAAVSALRLRAGAGGPLAKLTDERVPTLADALDAARHRVMLNLDLKTGDLAESVAESVLRAGMAAQVIMKSPIETDADIARVRAGPVFGRIAFMPIMTARAGRFARDVARLAPLQVPMVEVAYDDLAELDAARTELERQDIRLWINTLDVFHNLDHHDTRALGDPEAVWGRLLEAGAGAIQTDESAALIAYLAQRGVR